MLDALVLWKQPNRVAHWNVDLHPGGKRTSEVVEPASTAFGSVHPQIPVLLSGILQQQLFPLKELEYEAGPCAS